MTRESTRLQRPFEQLEEELEDWLAAQAGAVANSPRSSAEVMT